MLPHDHKASISVVRNKLSSHIDKNLYPSEAKKVANIINSSEFGRWLHICLHLMLDLTKLNIYWWGCDSHIEGYIRIMQFEPFIVTFKVNGDKLENFAGLHIAKESPKNCIPIVINSLITHSSWMFKEGQPRIGHLKEDKKENWNTFLGNFVLSEKYEN
jgi:hypothetical protein